MSKAREYLKSYVEQAEDTTTSGLSYESALSIERSGKFVEILFCTGGPHFEVILEFEDDEAGEYWFENAPVGGIAKYLDWGTSDYCGIGSEDAWLLQCGVLRDPDDLSDDDAAPELTSLEICTEYVLGQPETVCSQPLDHDGPHDFDRDETGLSASE